MLDWELNMRVYISTAYYFVVEIYNTFEEKKRKNTPKIMVTIEFEIHVFHRNTGMIEECRRLMYGFFRWKKKSNTALK